MDKALERKLTSLRKNIRKLDSALVAFSGGVDSTFLTRICREELGEKAVAVTSLSGSYPRSELSIARRIARILGVKHIIVDNPEDGIGTSEPAEKSSNIYSHLKSLAMRMKLKHVLVGSHLDDVTENGANITAARRARVSTPLLESGLSKGEIRLLAKELGLPNWDKPASSERKKSGKPARLKEAKEYLRSVSRGAAVKVRGKKIVVLAGKNALSGIARRFSSLERKMKSLGFSEVMLELA
jgi:uncharacterized protein